MKPFQPQTSLSFRTVNNFASHTVTPKKVLFLTYRFPYPLIGGDRLKSYHLLRHFSDISNVDLISLDEWGSATENNFAEIAKLTKTVTVVPFKKGAARWRAAFSILTKIPVEYAWYDSPEMQIAVNNALDKQRYDLIVCFFLRTAIYVKNVKNTPKLLVAEDSRLLAQERGSKKPSLSPEYVIRKIDAGKLTSFEPAMMKKFELTTFVAQPDQDRVLKVDPNLQTALLTNGVDTNHYSFSKGKKENNILFAGHLGIYHNKLMTRRILNKIYPLIKQVSPETTLRIVGKDPDRSLKNLVAATSGASLHSNVPDIAPYYEKASVFIHPQEIGAGIQNKLLESMASGTPVVTTVIGASGISGVIDRRHLLVSETDQEFANAALSLLNDQSESARLSENARKLIEQRYTWEKVFDSLDVIIASLAPSFFVTTDRSLQQTSHDSSR